MPPEMAQMAQPDLYPVHSALRGFRDHPGPPGSALGWLGKMMTAGDLRRDHTQIPVIIMEHGPQEIFFCFVNLPPFFMYL